MSSKELVEKDNYEERFDPMEYIQSRYKTPGSLENRRSDMTIKFLHKAITTFSSTLKQDKGVKVLEYGCGPVICNVISAAGIPQVSEIVLAEYTAKNRHALTQWLTEDPHAFDWTPYFNHVVTKLEGKPASEASSREKKIKAISKVVSCDISSDPVIEAGYEGPYDLVISLLCLEVSCPDEQTYRNRVQKLSALIKPGGSLLLMCAYVEDQLCGLRYYYVASNQFFSIRLSEAQVESALMDASISVERLVDMGKGNAEGDTAKFKFAIGRKSD